MICVIDYGMGNLRSVSKAIEKLGGTVRVTDSAEELKKADKVVLPGVGAFGDGCAELNKRGLLKPLSEVLRENRPFLGICLGMQLLFRASEESPGANGLAFFQGNVRRFRSPSLKIPHMGWNRVNFRNRNSLPFRGVGEGSYFYFVHSYYPVPEDRSIVSGTCQYGDEEFPAFIERGVIWASQFHPEKSQEAGLIVLKNFIAL